MGTQLSSHWHGILRGEKHGGDIRFGNFQWIVLKIAFELEDRPAIGFLDFHQAAAPAVVVATDQAVVFRIAAIFGVMADAGIIVFGDFDFTDLLVAAVWRVANQGDSGSIRDGRDRIGELRPRARR